MRGFFRAGLLVLGVLLLALGALWIAQGMALVRWPIDSFMIGQTMWVWRGIGLVTIGVAMALGARRI